MATNPLPSTDEGCIVLITPWGNGRSRRLIIPHDVAAWLRDELAAALSELKAAAKARRKAKRGGRA
jgi:hypothetical protein